MPEHNGRVTRPDGVFGKNEQGMAAPIEPIQDYPLPTQFNLQQMQGSDGNIWLRLELTTPAGSNHVWFNADVAINLGQLLMKVGGLSKSGLVVPN